MARLVFQASAIKPNPVKRRTSLRHVVFWLFPECPSAVFVLVL